MTGGKDVGVMGGDPTTGTSCDVTITMGGVTTS
jgi:hypothetical protein